MRYTGVFDCRSTIRGFDNPILTVMWLGYFHIYPNSNPNPWIIESSDYRYITVCLCTCCSSVYLNIPFLIVMNVLISLIGLIIYVYYADVGCDPLRSQLISNSNQLVPYFVLNVINFPGLPGIFLAVLVSGSMRCVGVVPLSSTLMLSYHLVLYK